MILLAKTYEHPYIMYSLYCKYVGNHGVAYRSACSYSLLWGVVLFIFDRLEFIQQKVEEKKELEQEIETLEPIKLNAVKSISEARRAPPDMKKNDYCRFENRIRT